MLKNEKRKLYREKNKEVIREKAKLYREKNKEVIREKAKIYRRKTKEKFKDYHKKYRNDNPIRYIFNDLKNRKNKSQKRFKEELDFDMCYIEQLYTEQKGKCYWTGLNMLLKRCNHPFQISVDRIDNNKPYIKTNIVLCCLMINYARNSCDYNTWNDIMRNEISIKYRRKRS